MNHLKELYGTTMRENVRLKEIVETQQKILDEKNIEPSAIVGTGKGGRITKDDAVNAVPSMGTPTGGNRGSERTKLSMLRRKVAERLVAA